MEYPPGGPNGSRVHLGDDDGAVRDPPGGSQRQQGSRDQSHAIGRINKHEIGRRKVGKPAGPRRSGGIGPDDTAPSLLAAVRDIASEGIQGAIRSVEQHQGSSAARQGLQAKRAGAGECIDHFGALEFHAVAEQNAENRLSRPVGGRAHVQSLGDKQLGAAMATGVNPHGWRWIARGPDRSALGIDCGNLAPWP